MRIVAIATERPVTVSMFFLAIVLFGLVSLSRLKTNLLPDLSYPTLTVRTELAGAAPVEIESLLTKPVEEAVGTVKNVSEVRSTSRTGRSDVTVQFDWGTDMNLASIDVREKLDILFLPLEASRPVLLRFDPSSEPVMRLALAKPADETENNASETTDDQLKELRRLAEDELKNDFEGVAGVAAVKVSGGLDEEIQITIDQQKLAQLKLSIGDISERIRAENVNMAGGRLEQGNQRYLVRTVNEFQSVQELRDSVIASIDNRAIYLRDIASVVRGYKDREAITRVNGQEAVELAVYKEGDANTVQVAKRVRGELEYTRKTLSDQFVISIIQDQSGFIRQAIDQVVSAAIWGGLLAVLILYGFLANARATLIIGITIPLSIVGTFALMQLTETSLNIMSLGGIALAVGLLVDNSIVVLENVVRKREAGFSLVDSSRLGASEVGGAVIASTLTTIAVFLPIIFVTGIAGQLFRDQALTVTYALLFSLILALVLIPMLAAAGGRSGYHEAESDYAVGPVAEFVGVVFFVIRRGFRAAANLLRFIMTPLTRVCGGLYTSVAALYGPALQRALEHRLLVVALALSLFVGAAALVPRLGTELIPQLAQGEFSLNLRLTPGTALSETDRAINQAYKAIEDIDDIASSHSVAGTGNRLDASPVDAGEHAGSLTVALKPGLPKSREQEVVERIRKQVQRIPGVSYDFSKPQLLNLSTPLEVVIVGFNLDDLKQAADQVVKALSGNRRFVDIRSSLEGGNPEIQIRFDQQRAAALGIATRDIADRVVANVRGSLATRYSWRDTKIDVRVRSVDTRASSLAEVRNLIINPAASRPVSLDDVAEITTAVGPAEVKRIDQERVAVISMNIAFGDLGSASAAAKELLATLELPANLNYEIHGQSQEMTESLRSMQFAIALAVFLVYLVMASQFESLRHPLVILVSVPLALVGAVGALFIAGMTLSVVAFIGAIMLVGIVVNNAIVLIDLINQLRSEGRDIRSAILEGANSRLRPIMMTTLTTTLGLIPMAMGFGEGSEVRAPMAVTVIGGLLVSTLLTLIVIPVVYSLFDSEALAKDNSAATSI